MLLSTSTFTADWHSFEGVKNIIKKTQESYNFLQELISILLVAERLFEKKSYKIYI